MSLPGFGDCVTAIQIVWACYTRLKGARAEFTGLRLELASLNSVLQTIQAEAALPNSVVSRASPNRRQDLESVIKHCRTGLERLQKWMFSKWPEHDGRLKDATYWWGRIVFAAGDKQELGDAKAGIAMHVNSLSLVLSNLTHTSLSRLEQYMPTLSRVEDYILGSSNPWTTPGMSTKAPGNTADRVVLHKIVGEWAYDGITATDMDRHRGEIKDYLQHLASGGKAIDWRSFVIPQKVAKPTILRQTLRSDKASSMRREVSERKVREHSEKRKSTAGSVEKKERSHNPRVEHIIDLNHMRFEAEDEAATERLSEEDMKEALANIFSMDDMLFSPPLVSAYGPDDWTDSDDPDVSESEEEEKDEGEDPLSSPPHSPSPTTAGKKVPTLDPKISRRQEEIEMEQKVIEEAKVGVREDIVRLKASADTDQTGKLFKKAQLQDQLDSLNRRLWFLRKEQQAMQEQATRQELHTTPDHVANQSRPSPSPSRSPGSKSTSKSPSNLNKSPIHSSGISSRSKTPEISSDNQTMTGGRISCDRCKTRDSDFFYHCGNCNNGDFDVCPECVDVIDVCRGAGHKVWKVSQEPDGTVGGRSRSERSRPR